MQTTPTRRQVALGAAWTVPAVAVAASAPAIAASVTCPTPTMPAFNANNWTSADLSPNQHNTQPGTGFDDYGWWSRDDVLRGQTTPSVETLTSSITLTAGCTYTFSYGAIKIQNNGSNQPDHTPQTVDFIVDGNALGTQTTDETSTTTTVLTPASQSFAFTYTPTTTGPVQIQFRFTLSAPVDGHYGNDDIRISAPAVTLS